MTRFSDVVTEFWRKPFAGEVLYRDERLSLTINPDLGDDERVIVLHTIDDSHTAIAVLPELAQALAAHGIRAGAPLLEEACVREALVQVGVVLHGADNLYYFPDRCHPSGDTESDSFVIRQLTAEDRDLFADFEDRASEQDREDAQVDLDDWAAFGVISDDQLVAVASTYPWKDSTLADIGVLTLATERGRGNGRRLVQAMARHAHDLHHELQYRCQLDNSASQALADSAGLQVFGRWEVQTPSGDDND
ncbi:GNAT family N-acetyltransferase [Leifsonia sp. YAF41]|uniref:GNAT family N-acetyltransferase n=1 Tax=Leifsonia sp. YAF41 TaxID=3233086 RepID=UPI003F9D8814